MPRGILNGYILSDASIIAGLIVCSIFILVVVVMGIFIYIKTR